MTLMFFFLWQLQAAVEEMRVLSEQAQHPKVKDLLTLDLRKLETELVALKNQEEATVAPTVPAASSGPRVYTVKLTNYAWDQSEKFVKIFVTLRDVQTIPAENITCTFGHRSMELLVKHLEGKNYHLPITNLLDDISVEASTWKVKRDGIVVTMVKATPGREWSHVTSAEKRAADARLPKKNLDSSTSDPSAGLMDMMRQMYEDGDDEMKRTIAKAWTESRDKKTDYDF
ncbi:hypothetical protein B566_EDAN008541 [Ephemera danica]|nr:hypothetical protein B566_EDAN008541 [Ephemera danica]